MQFKEPGEKELIPKQPNLILDQIKRTLGEMAKDLSDIMPCLEAPQKIEGCEILKDKTILLVDDDEFSFRFFVPHLIVETDGKAKFIRYRNQEISELIDQIIEKKPDIVLLDYTLSGSLKGDEVVAPLRKLFPGMIIGFSTVNAYARI
jgi:hypothetical protein